MIHCEACEGAGLIAFLPHDSPKSEADAGKDDLHFAVCLCAVGQAFRLDTNEGRRVAPQWRLWCAREKVDPSRVAMVEDVYDKADLEAAGLVSAAPTPDRHAALLAAGKKRK